MQKLHLLFITCCIGILSLLSACGEDPSLPNSQISAAKNNGVEGVFSGGLYKVWATINEDNTIDDVKWRTGSARVSKHTTVIDSTGKVTSDTLWLEWNQLPPLHLDSTEIPSTKTGADTGKAAAKQYKYDTTYFDTVAFFLKNTEQGRFAIQITNILPKIDSVLVGSMMVTPINDSIIVLAGHAGEKLQFEIKMSDAFKLWRPVIKFPRNSQVNQIGPDSLYRFYWVTPDTLSSDTLEFEVADERSPTGRKYKLVRVSFSESGSLWVSSLDGVSKVAETGQTLFTLTEKFGEVSDMSINPQGDQIFIADRGKNKVVKYSLYGLRIAKDSVSFRQPSALIWDLDARSIWIADKISDVEGQIRLFDLSASDTSMKALVTVNKISGPVNSISYNQYHKDELLFVASKTNLFSRIKLGKQDTSFKSDAKFDRPLHVSWDPSGNRIWVADSAHVYLLDTNGVVRGSISGFSFVGGLSAGAGTVCVADTRAGKVYRMESDLVQNIKVGDGVLVNSGFIAPLSVSVRLTDGACWVADPESGSLSLIDRKAELVTRILGFNRPKVVRVNNKIE
jgi:DNA-binding beta-propeller fold protein YncE